MEDILFSFFLLLFKKNKSKTGRHKMKEDGEWWLSVGDKSSEEIRLIYLGRKSGTKTSSSDSLTTTNLTPTSAINPIDPPLSQYYKPIDSSSIPSRNNPTEERQGKERRMSTTNPKYNLRNPLPLSAAQEAEVKQLYYKRVRSFCAPEIKGLFPSLLSIPVACPPKSIHMLGLECLTNFWTAFAECAVNRTVTATWVCRTQRLAMNSCMIEHAKPEEEDRAREEWFATHAERKRAKEEETARVERRREEVIRMMREDDRRQAEERGGS